MRTSYQLLLLQCTVEMLTVFHAIYRKTFSKFKSFSQFIKHSVAKQNLSLNCTETALRTNRNHSENALRMSRC